MSVLIMSIGIISVMTLFPVSLLRSVQATHLTHATRFRYNIESLLDLHPAILDQIQVPTHGVQRVVIDPMEFQAVTGDTPPAASSLTLAQHQVIFGWSAAGGAGLPRFTYNYDFDRDGDVDAFDMDQLVTLPDSWIDQGQYLNQAGPTIGIDNLTNTLTVTNADVNVLTNLNLSLDAVHENTRVIVFYDYQGRGSSEVRSINGINPGARTLTWIGADFPEAGGIPITPVSVRFEIGERRYTWMLTVRKRKDGRGQEVSDVDAVIFARRPFSLEDEEMVAATFTQGSQFVALTGAAPQFMKKGRFVFDVQNSLWYRVLQIDDAKTTIKIDRPAVENAANGNAMFMRGVVDVYRLPTFIREGAP
ncbi:MAG: hypothetical protein WEB58_07810 [Planctomycetaceae bacterium]